MKAIKIFIILQLMNVLYSSTGVLFKTAALMYNSSGIRDLRFLFFVGVALVIMGFYAFLWQWVLEHIGLSVAYMQKGSLVFWGLLWAFLIFGEKITLLNVIGAIVIFVGTMLVFER